MSLCSIASNRNLNQRGQACALGRYINQHSRFVDGTTPQRTMSATVEALIGAVFLDSKHNLEAVKVAMKGLGLV